MRPNCTTTNEISATINYIYDAPISGRKHSRLLAQMEADWENSQQEHYCFEWLMSTAAESAHQVQSEKGSKRWTRDQRRKDVDRGFTTNRSDSYP